LALHYICAPESHGYRAPEGMRCRGGGTSVYQNKKKTAKSKKPRATGRLGNDLLTADCGQQGVPYIVINNLQGSQGGKKNPSTGGPIRTAGKERVLATPPPPTSSQRAQARTG